MSHEGLNSAITDAITQAEYDERPQSWDAVSLLQEQLADSLVVSAPERRIAITGAFSAAVKAGDTIRAANLSRKYYGGRKA